MSERRKSKRFDSDKKSSKSGGTGGIPVFDLVDLKKNKDFLRLKHDLDERTRSRQNRKEKGPKQEVLYVDATRNVGVVLGEKDIGADMKKQVVKRYTVLLLRPMGVSHCYQLPIFCGCITLNFPLKLK